MDLGATVCLARVPRCGVCPLAGGCPSRGHRFEPLRKQGAFEGSFRQKRSRTLQLVAAQPRSADQLDHEVVESLLRDGLVEREGAARTPALVGSGSGSSPVRRRSATACAASPSPRPVNPRRSVVVARTFTDEASTPSAPARRLLISARWGAIRGSSPMTTQSAFTSSNPAARTSAYASASRPSESAPWKRASPEGNSDPMSPRPAAPSTAPSARGRPRRRRNVRRGPGMVEPNPAEHEWGSLLERMRVDAEADAKVGGRHSAILPPGTGRRAPRPRRGVLTLATWSASGSSASDPTSSVASFRRAGGAPTGHGAARRRRARTQLQARRRCRAGRRRRRPHRVGTCLLDQALEERRRRLADAPRRRGTDDVDRQLLGARPGLQGSRLVACQADAIPGGTHGDETGHRVGVEVVASIDDDVVDLRRPLEPRDARTAPCDPLRGRS